MKLDARDRQILLAVLAFALALRVGAGLASPNELWPDEVFQTMEQAHRVAFGPGIVPWEFRSATRSWLLPGLLAGVMKLGAPLGAGSRGYLGAVAVVLSLLSLLPIAALYAHVRSRATALAAALAALVLGAWFELVYFAPKALTEAVAAPLLLTAVLLDPKRRPLVIGALLGLTCALRVQLVPGALVGALMLGREADRGGRRALAAGLAAPIVIAGLLDAATWSYPFQSFVANVVVNVVQGKSAAFGTAPPLAYFAAEAQIWSWAALPVIGLAVLGGRRAPAAAAVAIATLVVHAALAHKEWRFVFPAIAIVIALAGMGVAELVARGRAPAIAAAALLVAASAWRGAALRTEMTSLALKLYPAGPQWSNDRGPLVGLQRFSTDPQICGVGLVGVPWYVTGGYAWLHRDVPIFEIRRTADIPARAEAVNALLVRDGTQEKIGAFARGECWQGACAYVREGGCTPVAGYSLNAVLVGRGE